jgi:hypothetical protein
MRSEKNCYSVCVRQKNEGLDREKFSVKGSFGKHKDHSRRCKLLLFVATGHRAIHHRAGLRAALRATLRMAAIHWGA